jgi:predicted unusual protein kinase regulating ubiquinone biosynthesis (AarF/ABC1/UbiB family)
MVRSAGPAGRRRAGDGRRRDEVARRLAALGLTRRPRIVVGHDAHGASAGAAEGPSERHRTGAAAEAPILRLRAALLELGPVFIAFGRYLSSRPDLLSDTDCQVLDALPGGHPPMAPEALHRLLGQELGRPPEMAFAAFEPQPFESTLVYQEHRARLAGGERVLVRVVRPELEEELERDLGLLPLLAPALAAAGAASDAVMPPTGAIGAFGAAISQAADLALQAEALASLGQDGAALGLDLCAPRVVGELCGRRVLTREDLQGPTLETFHAPGPAAAGSGLPEAGLAPGSEQLAVRLCQGWLRQAFFGRFFPAEMRAGDVRVLVGGRIAWTGGAFESLPGGARENLWEYLAAAAAHDPPRICAALLREMDGGPPGDAAGSELDQRVRQLVPFRDGGWGAVDDLAGYLFLHWRCATELGYRPRSHLLVLCRGLSRVAFEARRLAPGRDALRSGLEGARFAAGLGDVTRLFESEQMKQVLASYAAAALAMPERINQLLTLAAEGRATIKLEMVEPPAEGRRKDLSAGAMAVLAMIAAVVLLAHQLASAGVLGLWTERVAALLVGALGALLLRGLGRKS